MGRPGTKADGDLLTQLTPSEINDYKAGRAGVSPRAGSIVTVWRLPGRWAVWSEGPAASTWWLTAHDEVARAVVEKLQEKPSRGEPVVLQVWKASVAVRSRDIKPGGWA